MELTPSVAIVAEEIAKRAKNASYYWDPVLWAEEELGVVLWSKQKEVMRSVAANRKTAVKSCHSIGKTFLCALLTAWWVCTREDAIVQTTAPTWPQVDGLLWEEIRKLHAGNDLPGRITKEAVWNRFINVGKGRTEAQVAIGKKPADNNVHGFHGVHRPDGVMAILDEACGVVAAIYNGAEAITTFPGDRQLAVGNPDDPNTKFGSLWANPSGQWNLLTVSAYDTPWFTGEAEEMIKAAGNDPDKLRATMAVLDHLPQPEIIDGMKIEWGSESSLFKAKVLAEFPEQGSDSFFSQSIIDASMAEEHEIDYEILPVLGVDLAGWGDDDSVIYINRNGNVRKYDSWSEGDATIGVEKIVDAIKKTGAREARIDGGGLGGPIFDFLVGRDDIPDACNVIKILGTYAATDNMVYANARTEQYAYLREMMRAKKINLDILHDERLKKQLLAIKYKFNNKGALHIETKREMRSRGVKSPDELDAVVLSVIDTDYLESELPAGTVIEVDMDDLALNSDGAYDWGW